VQELRRIRLARKAKVDFYTEWQGSQGEADRDRRRLPQMKRIKPGAFSSVLEHVRNAPADLSWLEVLLLIDRCIGGKLCFWQYEILRKAFYERRRLAEAEGSRG